MLAALQAGMETRQFVIDVAAGAQKAVESEKEIMVRLPFAESGAPITLAAPVTAKMEKGQDTENQMVEEDHMIVLTQLGSQLAA